MSPTFRRVRALRHAATAGVLVAAFVACSQAPRSETPNPDRARDNPSVLEYDELQVIAASNMYDLLLGRFPGVMISKVGNGISVQIRGVSSFSGSNEALILVDGAESTGSMLAGINPAAVRRVEVIKGSYAALYGIRGGNGVLLITTNRYGPTR